MSTVNISPQNKAISITGFVFSIISLLAFIWIPVSLNFNLDFYYKILFLVIVCVLGAIALTGLVLNSIARYRIYKIINLLGIIFCILAILFEGFYMFVIYYLALL